MSVCTMLELLEAGVHFGHQTQRWNPKMKKYIYGERNGIYIINLQQTTTMLDKAYEAAREIASKGKNVVFVGTKKQATEIIEQEATRCNSFYISRRWLGGTLTNFETIRTRIKKLNELEELRDSGHFDRLPKKEVAVMTRQIAKLNKSLGGVKKMKGMPDLLFIIDQKRELIAIKEANKLNIPIIGLVDTNCDPEDINYVIPGNDDAIRAIKLIAGKIADAVLEGKALRESAGVTQEETVEKVEEVKPADAGVTEEDLKVKVEGLEEVIEELEAEKE
ncbi:MAG TPA: 30S ribosomal protein S2 [Cyanobacteria bacterium UBA9971]|nr:30S ribosomal protein S2 [Cyanobacteria bacterium UBA9971]